MGGGNGSCVLCLDLLSISDFVWCVSAPLRSPGGGDGYRQKTIENHKSLKQIRRHQMHDVNELEAGHSFHLNGGRSLTTAHRIYLSLVVGLVGVPVDVIMTPMECFPAIVFYRIEICRV